MATRQPGNVTIIDARKRPDLFDEAEGGRWVTLCKPHGFLLQHETKSRAKTWAHFPEEWCDYCAGTDPRIAFEQAEAISVGR